MIKLVTHSTDEQALLAGACRVARCIGGYHVAWIGLLDDDDPASLRMRAQEGLAGDLAADFRFAPDGSTHAGDAVARALSSGQAQVSHPAADRPDWTPGAVMSGVRALLALPLRTDGAIVVAVGDWLEVLCDIGINSVQVLLTALAQGARAGLIGKAYLYGLGAVGEAGVTQAIEIIRRELSVSMALTGQCDARHIAANVLLPLK